jgi:ferredoxin
MNFVHLKKIRTAVSLLFFFSILFIFIDFSGTIPPVIYDKITFLQLIPSVISFIHGAGWAASGFIIIFVITLIAGRVYCSSICPLGTLQDIIIYLSSFRRKRKFTFSPSFKILRYIILFTAALSAVMGNIILLGFLDPFSNAGRIFTSMVRPLLINLNNFVAGIFQNFKLYSLNSLDMRGFSIPGFIFASVFLIMIIILAVKKERIFCNTLCPAGTLLGIAARFSLIKIEIEENLCNGCGLCERVCKANCINKKEKSIDFERCIACYNCFTVCPKDGVAFTTPYSHKFTYSATKRNFLKNTGVYLLSLTGLTIAQEKIVAKKLTTIAENRKNLVTPSGSISIEHFNAYCTSCHLCVSACPTGVLQPTFLEYGFTGMLQPRMDYIKAFCNFECKICLDICPTDAITKLPLEIKKQLQTGKVNFIKGNCIVETEKKDCGACSEHCPTKAVTMVPVAGADLMIPEVQNEYCIGCGACEYACPTKPYKAIFVEGNPIHLTAKKKKSIKLDKKIDYKEEFPF